MTVNGMVGSLLRNKGAFRQGGTWAKTGGFPIFCLGSEPSGG